MQFMLDTNICSYILRNRPSSVKAHFDEVGPGALEISTVVLAELLFGATRHERAEAIRNEVSDFASLLSVIAWDEPAAEHYGVIRADLEKSGTPIGAMDMMIAAHARSRGATLVSNNRRHFDKVPGLLITNWT